MSHTPVPAPPIPGRLKIAFWLDAGLLLSICALETVPFTGLRIHEWLGVALIAMVVVHLLLSWTWIASATRRVLATRSNRARVNYLLNLCLFGFVTVAIFSGVRISQEAVPLLAGISATVPTDFAWDEIHDQVSNLVVIFAALHLAMNWDWAAAAGRTMLRLRKVL